MLPKKTWIPIGLVFLLVGCGLFYDRHPANKELTKIYKPVEIEKPTEQQSTKSPKINETPQGGHFHADDTWHVEPHEPMEPQTPAKAETLVETSIEPSIESTVMDSDFVHPTSTSSNPLFKDGVPEHLQCPKDLIGVYFKEVSSETIQQVQRIGIEILERWNPNRPLTEVWPAYIKVEKWYHDNAAPERAVIRSMGANRIDWQLQIVLDFPEIGVLAQEDLDRSSNMRMVEIGIWPRDFNAFTLPDGSGRTFRTDNDKRYEFTWSSRTETADGFEPHTHTYKTDPSNSDPNAEIVKINLDEITDEELEQLNGWNYNINPYTTGAYKLEDHK